MLDGVDDLEPVTDVCSETLPYRKRVPQTELHVSAPAETGPGAEGKIYSFITFLAPMSEGDLCACTAICSSLFQIVPEAVYMKRRCRLCRPLFRYGIADSQPCIPDPDKFCDFYSQTSVILPGSGLSDYEKCYDYVPSSHFFDGKSIFCFWIRRQNLKKKIEFFLFLVLF